MLQGALNNCTKIPDYYLNINDKILIYDKLPYRLILSEGCRRYAGVFFKITGEERLVRKVQFIGYFLYRFIAVL